MSHQVISLKYRPQRFEDVIGQDHITLTLKNAIEKGRLGHAYIFFGTKRDRENHHGKTSC